MVLAGSKNEKIMFDQYNDYPNEVFAKVQGFFKS